MDRGVVSDRRRPHRRVDVSGYVSPWPDRIRSFVDAVIWVTIGMTVLIPFAAFCVLWLAVVGKVACTVANWIGVVL